MTGTTYEKAVAARILKPLGLRHTSFPARTQTWIAGPHNRGYQAVRQADGSSSPVDVTEWNSTPNWASGDLISTTADLERFTVALFGGEVVPKPLLEEMFTVPEVSIYQPNVPLDQQDGPPADQTAGLKRFVLPGGGRWPGGRPVGVTATTPSSAPPATCPEPSSTR